MKYPNAKFPGMMLVTNGTIKKGVTDYFPNSTQKGGNKRLALWRKANNLEKLIDFCIDGYRAWGDSVLMGAGAYLKIGDFPDEIAYAKNM